MDTLTILKDKYINDVNFLTKEEFCNIYKYYFLVKFNDKDNINYLIDTQSPTISNSKITLEDILSDENIFNPKRNIISIIPVIKTRNNPFLKKITVGRASIHDIVIKEPSVSKFHAYFQIDDNENYYLVDNDSTNGTKVNDKEISSNSFTLIKDMDKITFSNIDFIVYTPSSIYDFIKNQYKF